MKKNEFQDQQPNHEAPPALSYNDVSQAKEAAEVFEKLSNQLYTLSDALRFHAFHSGEIDDINTLTPSSAIADELGTLAGSMGVSMQRHTERLRSLLPAEALLSGSL